MTMTRRRLLDDTFEKSVVGNPAIATDSLARRYPGIGMQGWTEQDGTPTPEAPVPIVSAGTQNQDTGKWEYEVEVGCGNLFNKNTANENKYINNDNGIEYDGSDTYASDYINVFGFDNIRSTNTMSNQWMAFYNHEKIFISGVNGYGEAIPVPQNAMYARFTIKNSFINTFSVNAGSTLLPYTTYRPPQTVTLTSDRPLTKWDKLTKKDGVWGWVYKSKEYVLNGNERCDDTWVPSMVLYIDDTDNYVVHNESFYCNNFETVSVSNTNGSGFSIKVANYVNLQTAESFKAFLAEKAQKGTPVIIWAETKKETFVPLSETEQEQMNNLYTYRPTTVLSNQQDCQMALTYKTKKSMGGGNLLDYRKLINPDKWSPVGSTFYRHFDISFKPKTTYKISVSVNNMHNGYKKDYIGKFALYLGETPDTYDNNVLFGNTNVDTVSTEYTFTTSENPFYLNLYVLTWSSEYLHIVFDELLPNIRLEEVVT